MIFAKLRARRSTTLQLCRRCAPARVLGAAGILLATACAPARAQFSGPPSLPGQEINRPFTLTTDEAILHPPPRETILEPGDQVTVKLYGDSDYVATARVSATGNVLMPMVGVVHFEGLTTIQAEQLLSEKLSAAGMYHEPQITLLVTDGPAQNITVIGEVHASIPAIGNRHLLDVLFLAGGLPASASHTITINRPGLADPIIVDIGNDPLNLRQNDIPVFAGDIIVVARIGVVYVLNGFKAVGMFPLNGYGPLTMTELAAMSGGVNSVAKYNDLRIIRTIGNRRTVTVVDIKKIENGKAPDPILQPNDIVYMPNSAFKSFFVGGTLSSILSYASLAISLSTIR
jgi:polysaccharide export outer membrane protein